MQEGKIKPFDFIFYVPAGYGCGGIMPNVEETADVSKVLTAVFENGTVQWPDVRV